MRTTKQAERQAKALRKRLAAGKLDTPSQQRLARLEDELDIQRRIETFQEAYVQAFALQDRIDKQYESCKVAIEEFTRKWGDAPVTEGKLGKLRGFPYVRTD